MQKSYSLAPEVCKLACVGVGPNLILCVKGSGKSQGIGVWQLDWGAGALAPCLLL